MSSSPDGPPGWLNFEAVLQARAAARQHSLHHSLRHLLEVIAGYTNGTPAWPSYETLAGITGLSASRVRQYSYTLVAQGYLTLTRRPRPAGGWGQPEWGLGQVVTDGHSPTAPQVEVSTNGHSQVSTGGRSSVHGRTHASVHGWTQKRRLPTTEDQLPLVGFPVVGVEEKDPPNPPEGATPKPKAKERDPAKVAAGLAKRQRVADVCDAIKDLGLKVPHVGGRDANAINGSSAQPKEIAEAWRRFAVGEWPPPSAHPRERALADGNRALWFVIDRLNAVLTEPPPRRPANPAADAELAEHRRRVEERLAEREHRLAHSRPSP